MRRLQPHHIYAFGGRPRALQFIFGRMQGPFAANSYSDFSQPLTLALDAAAALADGPLPASQLIATVCRMPGVPAAVADDIAVALLSGSSRFMRNPDGAWALTPREFSRQHTPLEDSALNSLSYLVVDVETTGLSPLHGDRITEVAAYSVRGAEITRVIDTLVNPRRRIPAYVTELTGISAAMVRNAPYFEDICEPLVRAMNEHVFVAHNANFDWRFISAEVSLAAGLPPVASTNNSRARLCTVKLARALLPGLPRRSLDNVAFHLGVEIEDRHRAGGDALATARILRLLLKRASGLGIDTWGSLENHLVTTRSNSRRARSRRARRARGAETQMTGLKRNSAI